MAGFECFDLGFGGSALRNPTTTTSTCDDQVARLNEGLNAPKFGVSDAECGTEIDIDEVLTFYETEECDAYAVVFSDAIAAASGEAHAISCLANFLFVAGDIATCEAAVQDINMFASTYHYTDRRGSGQAQLAAALACDPPEGQCRDSNCLPEGHEGFYEETGGLWTQCADYDINACPSWYSDCPDDQPNDLFEWCDQDGASDVAANHHPASEYCEECQQCSNL